MPQGLRVALAFDREDVAALTSLAKPPEAIEGELVAAPGLYLWAPVQRDAEPAAELLGPFIVHIRHAHRRVPVVIRHLADAEPVEEPDRQLLRGGVRGKGTAQGFHGSTVFGGV